MSLILYHSPAYRNEPNSVGTHVLAIGIDEYTHLNGGRGKRTPALPGLGQLHAPVAAAHAIATWFIPGNSGQGFNNPDTPLASVNLLVSPRSEFDSPVGGNRSTNEATANGIESAFSEWLSKLRLNERNVGVLYYCGYGVHFGNDIIIPSDFGKDDVSPWSDAINLGETITAIRHEVAGPLYFFLDMYRDSVSLTESDSPRPLLPVGVRQGTSAGHMLVLQGASPGGLAFAPVGELPYFTSALLEALSGEAYIPRGDSGLAAVTSTSLVEVVPLLVKRLMPQGTEFQSPHAAMNGSDRPFHLQRSTDIHAGLSVSAMETAEPGTAQSAVPEGELRLPYRVGGSHDFTRSARDDQACLHVDDYADVVAELFAQTRDELCFAIFGPWGRGKTFLADRVGKALAKKRSSRTIRFSAWQYPTTPEVWVYLYETFADAAFRGSLLVRLPNIARTAIAKNGYWGLLLIYLTIALGAVPIFSLLQGALQLLFYAYLVLGFYGIIFVWTLFSGVKNTKSRLTREYLTPNRHTEKLGLQATIGKDLRDLLDGWIPAERFDPIFVLGYWLITACLSLAAILRLGSEVAWSAWLRGIFGLSAYEGSSPVAASVAVALIVLSAALMMAWLRYGGRPPARILLVVDDLDRCRLEHLLSVVESIKLLVEDPAISKRVQVMMLVEEEVLKHAIFDKYGRLAEKLPSEQLKASYDADRLMRENCEKLFTAHLRLPQLSRPEVKDLVETFSGFRSEAAVEKELLNRVGGIIERSLNAPVPDKVLVKKGKPGKLMPRTLAARMPEAIWMEEPVPAEFRPATKSEMEVRHEEAAWKKEKVQPIMQLIADRTRELGIYLESEARQQLARHSVEEQVIAEDEVKAILAALVDEGIELYDHLGPRTVRAFLFRYQLARLILTKLHVAWTPVDLARDLAAKFMISAKTKSPLPPSLQSPDLVNLARVIEQVS